MLILVEVYFQIKNSSIGHIKKPQIEIIESTSNRLFKVSKKIKKSLHS